jgi:hypothetical protein
LLAKKNSKYFFLLPLINISQKRFGSSTKKRRERKRERERKKSKRKRTNVPIKKNSIPLSIPSSPQSFFKVPKREV